MNLISQDYLMHYGVKGMKWGVRHDKNPDGSLTRYGKKQKRKEIAAYRKKQMAKYETQRKKVLANAPDNSEKIEKLRKHADDLYNKYEFDGDDGGGGRTAADRKAGAEYMRTWDKIGYLEDQQDGRYTRSDHSRYVDKLINKKFGAKTVAEAYDTPLWNLGYKYANSGNYKSTYRKQAEKKMTPYNKKYLTNDMLREYAKGYDMILVQNKKTGNQMWTPRDPKNQQRKINMNNYDVLYDFKKDK